MEVEGGYARYYPNTINPSNTTGVFPELDGSTYTLQSGGAHDLYTARVNTFYDMPLADRLIPYVGIGAGMAYIDDQTGLFTGPTLSGGYALPTTLKFTENGSKGAQAVAMAELGVAVNLDADWAIVPSYRFEKVFSNGSAAYNANLLKLGLRYSL